MGGLGWPRQSGTIADDRNVCGRRESLVRVMASPMVAALTDPELLRRFCKPALMPCRAAAGFIVAAAREAGLSPLMQGLVWRRIYPIARAGSWRACARCMGARNRWRIGTDGIARGSPYRPR